MRQFIETSRRIINVLRTFVESWTSHKKTHKERKKEKKRFKL